MTRVTTTLLIVLVLANGTVGIMSASGLSDDLGVSLSTGTQAAADDAVDRSKEEEGGGFSTGQGGGETLFGLFVSGVGLIKDLVTGVFAFPTLLINLGFPSWIVVPLTTPLYIIAVLEILYVATGRDMV